MGKYKIGDKVKIREDLKSDCEYNRIYFATYMEEYKGKIATITKVTNGGNYWIDLDKNLWIWSDDMFESAIPTKEQLNNKISELEKQIAELKEQLNKNPDIKMPVGEIWLPEEDKKYYCNCYDGDTGLQTNNFNAQDRQLMSIGNCYPTKEKAEFEVQREKYTRLFRQYVEQHSESLDWNNHNEIKYSLGYGYTTKQIDFWENTSYQHMGTIYASSKQVLQEAIDFVGEDNVKKYILEIGE